MRFEQDYMMRVINSAAAALSSILFNKSGAQYDLPEENEYTVSDDIYMRLLELANSGHINEAENLLYENLDLENRGYLEMGIGFYHYLNRFSEDFLTKHDYTREEISSGINQLLGEYGLDSVAEFLEI